MTQILLQAVAVCSAHAEMIPHQRRPRRARWCLLRTRGDDPRLSRAAKFLEQQGLIKRILKPNITRNQTSVWVLLISPTPEQNLHDLNQALGHFNLPCVTEL